MSHATTAVPPATPGAAPGSETPAGPARPPKPVLLVGLGNPIAGDDGIGSHLAARLRGRTDLPDCVEVIEGGTDLLRLEPALEERAMIILLDALLDEGPAGRLLRFDGDLHELDDHGGSVHHLPPVQALRLLRCLHPALEATPVTFVGVTIEGVRISATLSPALQERLDALVDEVRRLLDDASAGLRRAG